MFQKYVVYFFLFVFLVNCDFNTRKNKVIHNILLQSEEPVIKKVISNLESHEIQILYTRILRDSEGQPSFERFEFQQDANQYFYPASTVKLPVAILSLQKIRKLQSKGIAITPESSMKIIFENGLIKTQDSTHPNNKLSIAHLIKKLFLVSDNEAYNYLFDFVGKDYLNEFIHKIGIKDFHLSHKFTNKKNQDLGTRFTFFNDENDSIYSQKPIVSNQKIDKSHLKGLLKGKGYMEKGEIVHEKMDFSQKNYASVLALSQIVERLFFPELFNRNKQFELKPEDYEFLKYWMSRNPTEVKIPFYNRDKYFDSYCKFFIYGDTKGLMNDEIRIYNKVGLAYGTTTDVAYIRDNKGIEFLLSATILTNENEIFNDNKYEIDDLGIPFLAALGREIYQFEKNLN
jgi:beta-lactamase class A